MTQTRMTWMLRALISIAGVVAAATLVASAAAAPAARVVTDPEHRFTIAVPGDWNVETSAGYRAPAVSAKAPTASGQPPDSVDVITQDLPSPISPQGCAGEAAQVMRFVIHRWTTLREGASRFAGLLAYSRSYTWRTSGGQDRRSIQTCVTLGRRAFLIVATTANTSIGVSQDLPRLEQIMATFRPNLSNLPSAELPGGSASK